MTGPVPAHVLREGAPGGACVVLAHGLEDGWGSWRPVADRLDPRWRVVALDLPWRAGNDYRWRHRASAADWLAAGLDAVGRPLDALVAHSFGANAALELMAAGDLWAAGGVVLMCPLYRPPQAAVTWRMLDRARRDFEAHIRDGVLARMGPRAETVGRDVLEGMMGKAVDRVGPAGLLVAFDRFVASADVALEAIDQRVMVLGGGNDLTLDAAAARMLADRIARAAVRIDDAFDHFCHIRRPDGVVEYLQGFLRGVPDAAEPSMEGRAG